LQDHAITAATVVVLNDNKAKLVVAIVDDDVEVEPLLLRNIVLKL
jgi:hypothetical protein